MLCACREPFGSSACDVNIKAPIDFDLVEDVFDSRNLSFVDIFGVNVKFSDTNTLYYGIKIADVIQPYYLSLSLSSNMKNILIRLFIDLRMIDQACKEKWTQYLTTTFE